MYNSLINYPDGEHVELNNGNTSIRYPNGDHVEVSQGRTQAIRRGDTLMVADPVDNNRLWVMNLQEQKQRREIEQVLSTPAEPGRSMDAGTFKDLYDVLSGKSNSGPLSDFYE